MTGVRPISEDDLHAHVDGVLTAARKAEVDAYLAHHPEVARRVEGFAAQRAALRAHFAPIIDEPMPPELCLSSLIAERARPRRLAGWQAAAAAVVLFAAGSGAGWTVRSISQPAGGGIASLVQEAADTYRTFGPDMGRPVEIGAGDRADLVKWVSRRLQRPVVVPDLSASGYRFLGGRVVATPNGPAGMLMYENGGERIAMLIRPMAIQKNMPMSEHELNGVGGIAWSADGVGYSLVGPSSPDLLHSIADEARRQIRS